MTGSDKYFAETLEQLIENLNRYSFISKIKIYDLGMEENQVIISSNVTKTRLKNLIFLNTKILFLKETVMVH